MRLLLDTHALLWWQSNNQRLGPSARALIADPGNDILVSVVSLWEILIKVRVGKLTADVNAIERALIQDRFERLAITPAHLATLATLPTHHRDPFDHLLIAQAITGNAVFVSQDRTTPLYPVQCHSCTDP